MRSSVRAPLVLVGFALAVASCSDEGTDTKLDAAVSGFDAPFFDVSAAADIPSALDAQLDAVADAARDTSPDGPVRCTPNMLRCLNETTAQRCEPTGDNWRDFVCTNGCAENTCGLSTFASGWNLHQFATLDDDTAGGLAGYVASQNDLVTTQTSNAMPAAYLYNRELESMEATGTFGVYATSDDDLVGFVFGWQDPQHFYLLDWKQMTQASACGTANAGAVLKVIKSDTPLAMCADFWNSTGSSKTKTLSDPTKNVNGWKDNATYSFRVVFRPGDIRIDIKEDNVTTVSIVSKDTTYSKGKFGFYSYSQEAVRYQSVRLVPASSQ